MKKPRNDAQALEFLASLEAEATSSSSKSYRQMAIDASNEAYRWGRWDRRTKDYNPSGKTGNSAINESGDLMHRRTRDSYLNNPQLKRCVSVLRDIIVGGGIQTFCDPIDISFGLKFEDRSEDELLASLNYALDIDQQFEDYAIDETICDVERNSSIFDMQRLVISEDVTVGTVLILECSRPGQPLCFQMIEREQIDCSKDRPAGRDSNPIVNGFELDRRTNREIGVWLYEAHPHDQFAPYSFSSANSRFIPKVRYQHIFKKTRPSQHSGATWLHAAGQPAHDRDTYRDSEIRTAVKDSLLAMYAKLENPNVNDMGFTDGSDDPDPWGRPEVSLGTSPIAVEIGTEEEVGMIESKRPNNNSDKFFEMMEHDIAGSVDLSYYSLTGRFGKTNYTGFKGAVNLEVAQMIPIQQWLGRKFVLPMRRRWNQIAVATGQVKTIRPTEFRKNPARYRRHDVIGPGRNLIDVEKESEGAMTLLRGGMSTLKIECARRGLHWIKVLRQIYLENKLSDLLGIALDHSKGQGGQTQTTTRETQTATQGDDE